MWVCVCVWHRVWKASGNSHYELELELIQSHMAQKPVLRGEVGCACVARSSSSSLPVVHRLSRAGLSAGALPEEDRSRG